MPIHTPWRSGIAYPLAKSEDKELATLLKSFFSRNRCVEEKIVYLSHKVGGGGL